MQTYTTDADIYNIYRKNRTGADIYGTHTTDAEIDNICRYTQLTQI